MSAEKNSDRVLVALSGGPESLVAAWLLKKQGIQLRGIHFDITGLESVRETMVALERKLGISVQVVDCKEEFAQIVDKDVVGKNFTGKRTNLKWLFQNKILFPKLFQLQQQYQFTQIATGHRVFLQQDPLQKKTQVFRYDDVALDESYFLIGLNGEQLPFLDLPLGSIPVAMMTRIAIELELDLTSKAFDIDWDQFYKAALAKVLADQPKLADVYSIEGMKMGSCADITRLRVGEKYIAQLDQNLDFMVFGIDSLNHRVDVGLLRQRSIEVMHFEEGSWFGLPDLKMNALKCAMIWNSSMKPVPVTLLQFEGDRLKAILDNPLEGDDANIFHGEIVIWIQGNEVLGGARLFGVKAPE